MSFTRNKRIAHCFVGFKGEKYGPDQPLTYKEKRKLKIPRKERTIGNMNGNSSGIVSKVSLPQGNLTTLTAVSTGYQI